MKKVSIQLKTGSCCIQSAAKRELRRISLEILYSAEENVSPVLSEQFELLEDFLKSTDFNKLRASDGRFAGIKDGLCILHRNDDDKPVITVRDSFNN